MLDLFNTKKLAQAQMELKNAQAKVETANKKTKTTAIIGGSTTGVAVAAAAVAHFVFGQGRKVNRDKIKNFDSVVEERDNAITAKVAADAKISSLETEKKGLESTCELIAGSAYNIQTAASIATGGTIEENATFQRACYDHDLLVKKVFNPKDDEEFMKLRNKLYKSFTDSIKELEKLDEADAAEETEEATEEKKKTEEATEEKKKTEEATEEKKKTEEATEEKKKTEEATEEKK